jgi:hypothetical protein
MHEEDEMPTTTDPEATPPAPQLPRVQTGIFEALADAETREYSPDIALFAADPWADHPAERAAALAPLRGAGSPGLTRLPAPLRYADGVEKIDLILDLPEPRPVVQALAVEELAMLVKDVGASDAGPLLALASPRQLQGLVDLDAWAGDRLDREAFADWLTIAREQGHDVVDELVAAQHDGVLTAFLAGSVAVYEDSEEVEQLVVDDDLELFSSPCGTRTLAARSDDPLLPAVRELLDSVYRQSVLRGRAILRAVRWELQAQLEESLFEDRNTRLREVGVVPRVEALERYAAADPVALQAQFDEALGHDDGVGAVGAAPRVVAPQDDSEGRLGLVWSGGVAASGWLEQALDAVPSGHHARLREALGRLVWGTFSARAETPSDFDELPFWARHALDTLALGLRHASGGDLGRAAVLLIHVPLETLFRAGHLRVVRLARAAVALRRALGGAPGVALLDGSLGALVAGLTRPLPELPLSWLDAEGFERGPATRARGRRPVATEDELAAAHATLAGQQAVVATLQALAGEPVVAWLDARAPALVDGQRDAVRLSTLLATVVASRVVRGRASLEPLELPEVQGFLRKGFVGAAAERQIAPTLRAGLERAILTDAGLSDAGAEALVAALDAALSRLELELGGLNPDGPLDPRFLGAALLIKA